MKKRRLSFKQKLLLGISLSLVAVFGIGGTIANLLIQERLQEQVRQQMDVAGQGIQTLVRSLVMSSIKNYLKGISESNLAYVEHLYARFKAGQISEPQAKALAEAYMLKQRVGSSGYLTAVDVSDGGIKLAVHPHHKGRDVSSAPFAQQMARQKTGYLEFEWKNPGDPTPRRKAEWISFFEPWQWVISAAPYIDEYPRMIDLAAIEAELTKVDMQGQGYAFIMDMHGKLLSHPTWRGRSMIDAVDADSGAPFLRHMIDSIHQALAQDRAGSPAGVVDYRIKDPENGRVYARMMNYRYVPETQWIIGVVTDLDKLKAPLVVIRNLQLTVMAVSILMALVVVLWAVRPMTRSIDILCAAVENIDGGNLDASMPSLGSDEIGRLAISFNQMAGRLARYTEELEQRVADRTYELEEANRKLTALSNSDALTGLANRRHFDGVVAAEMHRSRRYGQPLSLLILDIDHFKQVNDTFGHPVGDSVLKKVADCIRGAVRLSDSIARWGGEEFIVLMPNTSLVSGALLAERVRERIAAEDFDLVGKVTASLGVAEYLLSPTLDPWLERADQALYLAKQGGRNRVELDALQPTHHVATDHPEGSFLKLVWSNTYRCGNSIIDAQHEQLFHLTNDLFDALLAGKSKEEASKVLTSLLAEVVQHFHDEEAILAERGFPELQVHQQIHAELVAKALQLEKAFKADTLTLGNLFQFLGHEVVAKHMLTEDRKFFPLMAAP